ncbi:hypothetical protein KAU55_00555 [Candidatus Bathyarchaeota archaeon]|nr:hypothetical protein [Candidatus Bathyarchaeota archaeon]
MRLQALNRRLLQIEVRHYARTVHVRELEDKGKEITDLLRRYEEATMDMSVSERKRISKEVAHKIMEEMTV